MSGQPAPKSPEAAEIARRVKHFLDQGNLTQAELARRLEVSAVHVHRIVTRGSISSELLMKVPGALGVTTAYFWGAEIPEPGSEARQ